MIYWKKFIKTLMKLIKEILAQKTLLIMIIFFKIYPDNHSLKVIRQLLQRNKEIIKSNNQLILWIKKQINNLNQMILKLIF
jgi:hypothetical protein